MDVQPTSRNRRILVADDDEMLASTLALIFSRAGFECRMALSGEEAVETAKKFKPDVFLTDYTMGTMNGMEAAAAVHQYAPRCRIIVFSGEAVIPDEHKYRSAGLDFAVLVKPQPLEEILRMACGNPARFPVVKGLPCKKVRRVGRHARRMA